MTEEVRGLSNETLGAKSDSPVDSGIQPNGPAEEAVSEQTGVGSMDTTPESKPQIKIEPSEQDMLESTDVVNKPPQPDMDNSVNGNVSKLSQDVREDVKPNVCDIDTALSSEEKENVGDCNASPNSNPVIEPKQEPEIKQETFDTVQEVDFQPKIIKIVNMRGEPFMCQTCGYQSRHLRWLRHHETICQKQGPPTTAIPKGTLVFTRPPGMTQMMVNNNLVKMVYPGQTVRLISPQLSSTADLIANNTATPSVHNIQQVVTPVNMARFVTPNVTPSPGNQISGPSSSSSASSSVQNPLQCQLCSFFAVSSEALAIHMNVNHAPVYSCNYCNYKTKHQNDIKVHLECHCSQRPPKCYTCLICNSVIFAVEDIEKHFREKHPKYQLTPGNIPVRMGFSAPGREVVPPPQQNPEIVRRMQPMMMTPSRQKDILDGFHLCRYCPFKSKKSFEVNTHMKYCHLQGFEFDKRSTELEPLSKKLQKAPAVPGKIDLRTTSVESGNFESLEFVSPDSSPTFTSTTIIGRPKCAGKRRQDMSYVIQDKIDSIKCAPKEKNCHCEFCEFKTTTVFNLKRHMRNKHKNEIPQKEIKEDNTVVCQYCNESMNLNSLKRHIKSKHPEMIEATPTSPRVACPYCDFTTNNNLNLRRHAQKNHRDKFKGPGDIPGMSIVNKVACQYCPFETTSEQNLERHVNRIHRKHVQDSASSQDETVSPEKVAVSNLPVNVEAANNVNAQPGTPKEQKPAREKTLSCKTCEFKTAYSQNLRRHYEKNHKDVYPSLYPERYAREEAKKANAHAECKSIPNSSPLKTKKTFVVPENNVKTFVVPENNVKTFVVPDNNVKTFVVPENSVPVVKPINILPPPLNPPVIQSVGEPTENSTVNVVQITENPNSSTVMYKPNKILKLEPSPTNNVSSFNANSIHLQIPNHNNVAHASPILPQQNVPATSLLGPHLNDHMPIDQTRPPRIVPIQTHPRVSLTDQTVVNNVCDKL